MCRHLIRSPVAPLRASGAGGPRPLLTSYRSYSTYSTTINRGRIQIKHGVWDPMPELTITPPSVDSRVDFNTCTIGDPMPESTLTLCQSQLYPPDRDLGFGLNPCYRSRSLQIYTRQGRNLSLKGPKHEIFESVFFPQIRRL